MKSEKTGSEKKSRPARRAAKQHDDNHTILEQEKTNQATAEKDGDEQDAPKWEPLAQWVNSEVVAAALVDEPLSVSVLQPEPAMNKETTEVWKQDLVVREEPCPICYSFERYRYIGEYGEEMACAECGLFENYFGTHLGLVRVAQSLLRTLEQLLALAILAEPPTTANEPGATTATVRRKARVNKLNSTERAIVQQAQQIAGLGRAMLGD